MRQLVCVVLLVIASCSSLNALKFEMLVGDDPFCFSDWVPAGATIMGHVEASGSQGSVGFVVRLLHTSEESNVHPRV